ncbi:hypothetical protein GCM10010254_71260 [Streptomyces chromofuscus]|nr:hypothetical protein GCM10010254_71260 [Streptomyces chromofuscus]
MGRPAGSPLSYLCKAARLSLFWQFFGIGDPDANEFACLRRLDDLAVPGQRIADNARPSRRPHGPTARRQLSVGRAAVAGRSVAPRAPPGIPVV